MRSLAVIQHVETISTKLQTASFAASQRRRSTDGGALPVQSSPSIAVLLLSHAFEITFMLDYHLQILDFIFLIAQNLPKRQDVLLYVRPRSCRVKLLKLKLLRVTVACVCWTGQRSSWLCRVLAPTSWNLLNRNFNHGTAFTFINKDWGHRCWAMFHSC